MLSCFIFTQTFIMLESDQGVRLPNLINIHKYASAIRQMTSVHMPVSQSDRLTVYT